MDTRSIVVWLAGISLGANLAWVAALVYLHLVERSVDPARQYVSEYVLSGSGRVMTLGFAAMALAGCSLAVAVGLPGWRGRPLALALLVFGASMAVAGWFPTDPSTGEAPLTRTGQLHNLGAHYAFLALVVAAGLSIAHWFGAPSPHRAVEWAWLVSALTVGAGFGFARYGGTLVGPGIAQRVFLAAAFAWLTVTALRVLEGER